ncbi:tumor suppressor candidate 5 homolog isoform X1 [Mizuhopecten yessoensis]|uniref:tumor suppressor candidate 5 homolog isoform X1 n=1 Tax=Mizuhopecten yessoensis TaxID=6573 RepID=UPI000B45DD5D|nr:tumor suppressor candidate 5 homolog isoform X1 [Mizuhopecten yessoensis]
MSSQNYERVYVDELQRTPTRGVSGNLPPYREPMPHTGGVSGNLPPYREPMPHTGTHYGQAYPQHTTSSTVVVQQPQTTNMVMRTRPNDYMVWSVIGCLFCLWPVGLCAIAASQDSRSKADNGNIEGAKASSRWALQLNALNAFLGAVLITVLIVLYTMAGKQVSAELNGH